MDGVSDRITRVRSRNEEFERERNRMNARERFIATCRFEPVDKKALSVAVPKIKQKRERGQDQEKEPKAFHQTPTDQVFEVR